jgi:putative NADH-flavin reductase
MRLTIEAATGGVGGQLLGQAVAAGHDVTVLVRNPDRLAAGLPVRVVVADLAAAGPEALQSAVDGADAVLSGLGARSGAEAGVASRGTRALVQAMGSAGVRRIVVVSAASVGTVASPGRPDPPRHNPGDGFFMRHLAAPLAKAAFRRHYDDLALMEDVLRDSDLDWSVARPPRLLDRSLKRSYRTAYEQNVRGGMFISRADVARLMLDVLDRPETIHRVIGIAY